jgi:hypothetical protein
MSPNGVIQSRQYREMRAELKAIWQPQNKPCALCFQPTIDWDGPPNEPASFELHHPKSRKTHPHLALDRRNALPTHSRCNRIHGTAEMPAGIGDTTEDW